MDYQSFLGALFLVGGLLVLSLYYLSLKNTSGKRFVKIVPGWNNPQTNLETAVDPNLETASESSLYQYLLKAHEGGGCPVKAFWWKDQHVASVCSLKSYKDTENLYNRPVNIFGKDVLHGHKAIQCINGSKWKDRKAVLYKCVRGENLESFQDEFVQLSQETLDRLKPGERVEVMRETFRLFLKVIVSTLLGNIFEDDRGIEELVELYDCCKREQGKWFVNELDSQRDTPENSNFDGNLRKLCQYMKKMLHLRKTACSDKKLPVIDALLEADYDEDEAVSHMLTFLGGYHTMSYYTTWLLFYLSKNLDIQEKLAAEIAERVNNEHGTKLQAYVKSSSSYLRQVLDEALRLSSTSFFAAHYSDEDMEVEGYHVPAMTPIIHALDVTMHSSDLWDNPNQFDPDRFSPNSKHSKRGREFRPFGVSCSRRCPANLFTYNIVSIFTILLIQRYIILPVGGGKEMKKKTGLAASPAEDVYIEVKQR